MAIQCEYQHVLERDVQSRATFTGDPTRRMTVSVSWEKQFSYHHCFDTYLPVQGHFKRETRAPASFS